MFLKKIPVFTGLSEEQCSSLWERTIPRRYPRGSVVINQGDNSDSLYIIESGIVKIYMADTDGREFMLGTIGEGEYFGELALLDNGSRSASVVTLEPCYFRIIKREDFLKWVSNYPDVLLHMIRVLVKRVRDLNGDISSLALLDVYGRVARILLQRATLVGGQMVVEHCTQQMLANMAGASREMISRILKDLRQGGYLEVEEKRILIKNRLPSGW